MIIVDLKVISFNVRTCGDPNGHSIKERAPRIMSILAEEDADIMGFQEYTPEMKSELSEKLAEKYDVFDKLRAEGDRESVPIFWKKDRFECLDKGYFWFSDTPEKESKGWDEVYDCYRICMWAVLKDKKTDKSFVYFNTHFGFGDKGQVASVKLIKECAEKIGKFPVIITGDFNMKPDSKAYAVMTDYFTDVNVATANNTGVTFHNYSVAATDKQSLIDYCFIDKNFTPVNYKILDKTFGGKFPSDHYGIMAEVKLQ